jgi:hypothetical protein
MAHRNHRQHGQICRVHHEFAHGIGFAENLPSVGYTKCNGPNHYSATHNPWVHFLNLPPETNQPFANFPSDFSTLPTVAFVVPAGKNSHNLVTADGWLKQNIDPYIQWALQHNSVLVLTCDEDNKKSGNHIPTLFIGQNVQPGQYDERINHFSVLRTIQDMYGLQPLGKCADAIPILAVRWLRTTSDICSGRLAGYFSRRQYSVFLPLTIRLLPTQAGLAVTTSSRVAWPISLNAEPASRIWVIPFVFVR